MLKKMPQTRFTCIITNGKCNTPTVNSYKHTQAMTVNGLLPWLYKLMIAESNDNGDPVFH